MATPEIPVLLGLATLPAPTWADVQAALYAQRFTGAVTLHLANGVPKVVEFPGPQLRVGGLDKPAIPPDST